MTIRRIEKIRLVVVVTSPVEAIYSNVKRQTERDGDLRSSVLSDA